MDFCDFLIQMMNRQSELPGYGIALTQVLQKNLSLAETISASPATTMSNHRSFQPPNMEGAVKLGSELALGNVVARIEVDYDVSCFISALSASEIAEPKHEPAFFIWQFSENGALRIVKVDPFVFHAIGHLEENPMTAAELIGKWIEFPANVLPDFQLALSSLSEASEVGLVQIKGL